MIVTKTALPRRTFLRGLGTALSLPLLDAMVPALSPLRAQTLASSIRRLGYVYIPDGHERRGMDAADRGTHHGAVAVSPRADAGTRPHHRREQPRAAQRLHHWQSRLVQLRVPQLLAREENRRQRLRAGHHGRSDRCACARRRYADSVTRDRDRPHRAGRELRQRLRLRLSEQSVVVIVDDATADRGRPARRLRAAVRRRRQPGAATCRAEEEREHSRLDDGRPGAPAGASSAPAIASAWASTSTRCARSSDASSERNRATPRPCRISIARPASRQCGKTMFG